MKLSENAGFLFLVLVFYPNEMVILMSVLRLICEIIGIEKN